MEFSSPERRKQVLITARKRGVSMQAIASNLGISRQRILQLCGSGLGTAKKRNKPPTSYRQRVCRKCGATYTCLAGKHHTARQWHQCPMPA